MFIIIVIKIEYSFVFLHAIINFGFQIEVSINYWSQKEILIIDTTYKYLLLIVQWSIDYWSHIVVLISFYLLKFYFLLEFVSNYIYRLQTFTADA